ncbi:hypothetical protein CFC21_018226 [Triticum aestivum]|uniref:Uncharacterized protein n=2 Tax=Triticum aestivum TaxID=4565 RepID=A0A3B6B356_WHEAT|nr:hypothetical protein CFC21_018226 [Triticum aestivum]
MSLPSPRRSTASTSTLDREAPVRWADHSSYSAPSIGHPRCSASSACPSTLISSPESAGLFCSFSPKRASGRSGCTVPVAQRVALRLVQELGGLGPKDRMTPSAAAALLKRFEEPLSRSDIKAIAKLTGLDSKALEIAAGMAGADAEDVA